MARKFAAFGLTLLAAMPVLAGESNERTIDRPEVRSVMKKDAVVRDADRKPRSPRDIRPHRPIPRTPRPAARRPTTRHESPRSAVKKTKPTARATTRRQVATRARAGDRKTVVMRLNHVPADDTGATVREWLNSEGVLTGQNTVTVVAMAVTNSLILSGTSEQLAAIRAVIEQIDRPSPRIRVKAVLIDLVLPEGAKSTGAHAAASVPKGNIDQVVAQLKKRGEVRVLACPEILTNDNQSASLQFGKRVPRIVGASVTSRGQANQVTLENVGTMLGVTGRVANDDSITLEIKLERSHLGLEEEGTPVATTGKGEVVRAPQVATLTLQTTVSLRSGQTTVLGGMVYKDRQRWGEQLLLLQAEVIR